MSIKKEQERGTRMMPGDEPAKARRAAAEREREGSMKDLTEKETGPEPFYGDETDPEALYDKRRVIEEG